MVICCERLNLWRQFITLNRPIVIKSVCLCISFQKRLKSQAMSPPPPPGEARWRGRVWVEAGCVGVWAAHWNDLAMARGFLILELYWSGFVSTLYYLTLKICLTLVSLFLQIFKTKRLCVWAASRCEFWYELKRSISVSVARAWHLFKSKIVLYYSRTPAHLLIYIYRNWIWIFLENLYSYNLKNSIRVLENHLSLFSLFLVHINLWLNIHHFMNIIRNRTLTFRRCFVTLKFQDFHGSFTVSWKDQCSVTSSRGPAACLPWPSNNWGSAKSHTKNSFFGTFILLPSIRYMYYMISFPKHKPLDLAKKTYFPQEDQMNCIIGSKTRRKLVCGFYYKETV